MRILYVASDQTLPGETGGSVHVHEISEELSKRGHEVHAVVRDQGEAHPTDSGYSIHRIRWAPSHRFFRFRARPQIADLIQRLKPDVLMERYYNFGGEGILSAEAAHIPSLLEVNSPVVDHPGSMKAALDTLLITRPMRRYRERLARSASALISPIKEIVPEFARAKTHVVTWGANIDAFHPGKRSETRRLSWGASAETCVVLFSGSHRSWHGVDTLRAAARRLKDNKAVVFVLAGGEHKGVATDFRGHLLGRTPYRDMPEVTASADLSVAPYDRSQLASLKLGFFWSPLKVFEALASGVPMITLDIPPLHDIVRADQEGVFFKENDAEDLARVISSLASDRERRLLMGRNARARAPHFSWAAHAAQVESILEGIRAVCE
ncbi:MAG: glycosyltransferase family 4 protein [Vicinamibacteria bacterium]|nr:glycosyltransferase family 4 protein [Vicinamibacteria bacterium]